MVCHILHGRINLHGTDDTYRIRQSQMSPQGTDESSRLSHAQMNLHGNGGTCRSNMPR